MIRLIIALVLLPVVAFAAKAPDSSVVTGPNNVQVPAANILITPSGGIQTTLGAALSATGGLNTPNTWTAPQLFTSAGKPANDFWANDYGQCVWSTDSASDVGPCVNLAIAAASAAGGGNVRLPAGDFNFATYLVNNTSGVHLVGAGVGIVRDTFVSGHALAATRLVWTGAAGTGPGLDIEPAPAATQWLYSADVSGITVDCSSLLDTCVQIKQTGSSIFRFGQGEARKTGVLFTTNNIDGSGTQGNTISLWVRNIDPAFSASGVVFDGGPGPALYNTSYNPGIEYLTVAYGSGDGIVIGNTDNNVFPGIISAFHFGSTTTGSPIVCTNTAYTPPSGVATSASCTDSIFTLVGSPMRFLGYTTGSVLTQGGGNTGTAALNAVTLTTNAASAGGGNYTLTFSAVSGVVANESVNCGGTTSGVYPNTQVQSTTGTTVVMRNPIVIGGGINGVASGQACTFSYALTSSAAPGTYTITAASASTFNITAPSGGHTQSAVAYSGGAVAFTDLTLPLAGTPVTGDTWTLVVPIAARRNQVAKVDKSNSISDAFFEAGSTGVAPFGTNSIPYSYGTTGQIIAVDNGTFTNSINTASGPGSLVAGGLNNTTFSGALYGFIAGGFGNLVSGANGAFATGQNCSVSGISGFCSGFGNSTSGSDGYAHGNSSTDRGRFASEAFGSGTFAVQGDSQISTSIMRGTSSTGTVVRLTADGLAAGAANCINIPNNSAYLLTLDVVAFDHTTVTKNAIWPAWTGLLTRGASAAATAVTMNATPTPVTNGTLTGQAIAATADTTNGCLNVSYTPPTSNTDKFNGVVRVTTVEVQ